MTRLAKALGFATFRAFQDDFRGHVAWGRPIRGAGEADATALASRADPGQLEHLQAANIESLVALNPPERFRRAATMLLKAQSAGSSAFGAVTAPRCTRITSIRCWSAAARCSRTATAR